VSAPSSNSSCPCCREPRRSTSARQLQSCKGGIFLVRRKRVLHLVEQVTWRRKSASPGLVAISRRAP
jgi:hypothetical protein